MNNKIRVILIISLILLFAGFGLFQFSTNSTEPANVSKPTTGELDVQLGLEKSNYETGETITFTSFIKNPTANGKAYSFNSTCTAGSVEIDEQPTQASHLCGTAITDVTIGPYRSKSYEYQFTLVEDFSNDTSDVFIEYDGELKLAPGPHQAVLKWQGFESNILTFNIE